MTKSERAALARGINPLTGLPLTATTFVAPASGPAAATAAPAWVTEAKAAVAAAVAPQTERVFYFGETGESNSGNPTVVLFCRAKNGVWWKSTVAADMVRAVQNGKVLSATVTRDATGNVIVTPGTDRVRF